MYLGKQARDARRRNKMNAVHLGSGHGVAAAAAAAENKNSKPSAIFHYSRAKCVHGRGVVFFSKAPCRLFVDHYPPNSARATGLVDCTSCLLTRTHASKTTRVFAPTSTTRPRRRRRRPRRRWFVAGSKVSGCTLNLRYSISPGPVSREQRERIRRRRRRRRDSQWRARPQYAVKD